MTDHLRNKCELFTENRSAIVKKFLFENSMMAIVAGLIFTGANQTADTEKLTECRKILEKHTGFFSKYRNTVKLALISEMALSKDPEQYIDDVKEVYRKLNKGKIKDNTHTILAAMLICAFEKQDCTDEILEKYHEITQHMEKQHPILTDSEDISYVTLLALSDRPVDLILSDINESFDYLKNTCKIKAGPDAIQGLGELLALTNGDIREKCDRVVSLYHALKEYKLGIDDGFACIALGTLVGIDETAEQLAHEIIEADEYLKQSKGFDEKSVDKNHRLMFAIILVAESCEMNTSMLSNTLVSSALTIIRWKQIATMITIISNILPSAIGALANQDSTETDKTSDSEVQNSESSVEQDASAK